MLNVNVTNYRKATCQLTAREKVYCVDVASKTSDLKLTVDVRKLPELVEHIDFQVRVNKAVAPSSS